MNHKPKVNTEKMRLQEHIAAPQSKSTTRTPDHTAAIRQQAHDIESHALTAQTLCEICFEIIDRSAGNPAAADEAFLRLDALIKAVYRNAVLAQESSEEIAHLVFEGGAA